MQSKSVLSTSKGIASLLNAFFGALTVCNGLKEHGFSPPVHQPLGMKCLIGQCKSSDLTIKGYVINTIQSCPERDASSWWQ